MVISMNLFQPRKGIPRTELTYEDIIAADYDLERAAHEDGYR